ncbi:vegetative incompatibility protein HET-E-1 [Bisporella sp. PMI_857]|nr:vegetative incompatibility protein HET-E-1 [Bisporella sp. PMI_857]
MRLLERNSDGEFSLTKDFGDDIPLYAILSHTWGLDTEEVTFRDLIDGAGKSKAGYDKIRFCGEQARHDGLEYFWVDTCCIDKSNNNELAEAINSMFRWYHNAAKCYVYLSDVSITEREASNQVSDLTWEPAFRASRWFTRGWTLQELLAPGSVEFFSQEGSRLGDKRTLERQIHKITGIAISALQGAPLSQFEVEERLLWAENRQTTRKEDKAYSLLGIFDIYMPLIYGEGSDNAFIRLRDEIDKPSKGIDRLPYAVEAPFNSYAKQHSPSCLPNTRVELLRSIYTWADGQDKRCIFWLNGLAGTGKSTLARTVARRYFDQRRLGASFFFSRGGGDVGHAGKFFTTIARQLARNVPQIRRFISNAAIEQNDIANQSFGDQWRQLVLRPLARLDSSSSPSSYVLIIDALDECDSKDDIQMILQLLTEAQSLKTVRLRIFLTSRPEIPIRHGINRIPQTEHKDFVLQNIPPAIINHDISLFLEYSLGIIGQEWTLGAGWPGEQTLKQLVLNAGGLFIWAATACRFVREGKRFALKRLDTILQGSGCAVIAPEKHLDQIYITVLKHSVSSEYTDEEKRELFAMLRHTLGSIVVLLSPLSAYSLSRLLHLRKGEVDQILEDLHAILDIPENQTHPLRLHHPSFRDFLLNKDRCRDLDFQVVEEEAHHALATSCIQILSISLKKNICGLEAPGVLANNIESDQVEKYLPAELQYACLYWVQHLKRSGAQLYDQVHQFLQDHLLHWLEALGWMRKTSEGIFAILSLETLIPADKSPNLHAFIRDAKRFALYNRSVIEQAPLQLYSSALVFAPEQSIVQRRFEGSISPWIQRKSKVQADWSAALQTLEGHSYLVTSVAFSPGGKQVVSGSGDMTVRLWDAVTGAALQTLEGHSGWVKSVAFSPDGKQVVSGSDDKTVRLWDAVTGAALQTLEGHSSRVTSVAFSPDNNQVVSGSEDKTVRLWDAVAGAALQTLEGHSRWVKSVAFSPDGKQVVSGSYDKTVRLWDAATGAALQTLEGHSGWVTSVAFSPDGNQVVSGSDDKTVRLWDAVAGAALQTLEGHSRWVKSVAFSPDGKQVVSGSYDKTVRLWDAVTGAALQTLEGHSGWVTSVAFSPDGNQVVSGSDDKTVRLWDAVAGAALQTLEGHSRWVRSVAFSPDGKQVVSGSYDKTVRLWDAATGAALQTLEGHSGWVTSVAFSPDGKQVVSTSEDKTVRLWDAITGAALQTLKGHSGWVTFVAFSPDSKQVVSGSYDMTVRLWHTVTGAALQTLEGHSRSVESVAFSPNGKQVLSGSDDKTVRLWDATTGAALQTLEGHSGLVTSVAFSPDSKQVVSRSEDKTVRLWDAVTGAALQTLEGHSSRVTFVAFSPDGNQVVSDGDDKTVRLWDTVTGAALQTLEGHSRSVGSVAFLQDGRAELALFVANDWIVEGGTNILWLPPDYRPTCEAVWDKVIVLGHSSGRISILRFKGTSRLV